MSLNIRATLSAGVQSMGLSVLSKSDRLNRLADRVTSGRVNRDTLAQSVWINGLRVGASAVGSLKQFGDRGDIVGQHVEKFLLAQSTPDVQESFRGLAHELLLQQLPHASHPLWAPLHQAAGWGADFAGSLVEEKGIERTLGTLVAMHGREVLADRLQLLLGDSVAGGFAFRRLMEVLDHSILNNPDYRMPNNSKYGYAADLLYLPLSGGDTKPLENRAVGLLKSAPAGAQSVLQFVRGFAPAEGALSTGIGWVESAARAQPLEKVLATLGHHHPESKKLLLEQGHARLLSLGASAKYSRVFTNILDRAILSNADLVQAESPTYGLLADMLHAGLTGDRKLLTERSVQIYEAKAPRAVRGAVHAAGMAASATRQVVSGTNYLLGGTLQCLGALRSGTAAAIGSAWGYLRGSTTPTELPNAV